jgi:sigma-B regulation protein RsbU (phosphoserine phosphatase)
VIQPNRVVVFSKDKEFCELLEKQIANKLPIQLNPDSIDANALVLVDEKGAPPLSDILKTSPRNLVHWLGRQANSKHIEFILKHRLNHLIGFDAQRTPYEITLLLRKLFAPKIWGLTPYLEDGTLTDGFSLSESKREMVKINEILKVQNWGEFFDSPIDYLTLVANELVSNALYNGPEEKRINQNYPVDRKDPVFLKGNELVQVCLGIDSHIVGLSVMDCFGTLTWEKTVENLHRSFTEKTVQHKKGGAGLGLYLAFSHANQFIINRKPSLRTEVICIIEKNRRYKNYKERLKSFHFFEEA